MKNIHKTDYGHSALPMPKIRLTRVAQYGSYLIKKWSELGMVTIELTIEANKKGKKLAEALSTSKYTDLVSAKKAIDKFEDKKHAAAMETIYSSTSNEHINLGYQEVYNDWN